MIHRWMRMNPNQDLLLPISPRGQILPFWDVNLAVQSFLSGLFGGGFVAKLPTQLFSYQSLESISFGSDPGEEILVLKSVEWMRGVV